MKLPITAIKISATAIITIISIALVINGIVFSKPLFLYENYKMNKFILLCFLFYVAILKNEREYIVYFS